jgi:hypothetical protein
MADEAKPEGAPPGQQMIQTDVSGASTVYSNFCQATSAMGEELVLSFGLNLQVPITDPVKITHRVVINFYTAKRLLHLLGQVIAAHEATFGVLELDVQRRARTFARPSGPPSTLKPGPA